MKYLKMVLALTMLTTFTACNSAQKKSEFAREQIVEFKESEVPYVQVSKKNGKVITEIIDPATANMTTQQ